MFLHRLSFLLLVHLWKCSYGSGTTGVEGNIEDYPRGKIWPRTHGRRRQLNPRRASWMFDEGERSFPTALESCPRPIRSTIIVSATKVPLNGYGLLQMAWLCAPWRLLQFSNQQQITLFGRRKKYVFDPDKILHLFALLQWYAWQELKIVWSVSWKRWTPKRSIVSPYLLGQVKKRERVNSFLDNPIDIVHGRTDQK